MHLKEVEFKSTKGKSHKTSYSPTNLDDLLGSRQGVGVIRIPATAG